MAKIIQMDDFYISVGKADGTVVKVPRGACSFEPHVGDTVTVYEDEGNYVLSKDGVTVGEKSKIAAGLLAIFLGGLGVHNFYLGKTGRAIAQLLISLLSVGFLAWVSAIWSFIEGICILVSSEGSNWHKDGQGRELRD